MAYTSDYAQKAMSKHGGGQKAGEKERKLRSKATAATMAGKEKKAERLTKKANKKMKKMGGGSY